MTSKRQVSTSALPSARSTIISKSISISPTQLPFDNLYNISPLLKRMRNERTSKMTNSISESSIRLMNTRHQQQTLINTPLPVNQLKNNEKRFNIDPSNNKFHRRKQQLLKSKTEKKHQFNSAAYCVAYCTIIIIGTIIGGWSGGLFEFIFNGYNGCNNEYRGYLNCQIKYESVNVTTHCMNIFYKKSIPNESPYICLCRFRNQSTVKYRDCDFLHAKIQ